MPELSTVEVTFSNKTIDLADNTLQGTTAEFNAALSDGDFATLAGAETLTNKSLTNPALTGIPTAPTASAGTNTTQVATCAFTIAEILARIASLDVMTYKGAIDCSANPNYPAANAGDTYRISVGGKIGGGSGTKVEAGDMIICHTDSSAGGTQASVGADWDVIQVNIDDVLSAGTVNGATSKATPVDADEIPLLDSAASYVLKKLTWTNLKATLKTYFDTLYASASGGSETTTTIGALINGADAKTTPVDADMLGLMDSEASNVLKKFSWANLKAAIKSYYDSVASTLTNKTFDAEGTGNSLSIPEKLFLPAAGVNGSTAAPFWDLPASNAPTASNVAGSNVHKAVLSFPDSGNSYAEITLRLPSDWSGAIDAVIIWYTTATSGNCKWNLATSFGNTDGSETDDNAYNTAQSVTTAAPGTGSRVTSSSISSLTTTGGGAGDLMHLKISRDGTDGSDTIGAAALLVGVELTIRRTI